MVNRQNLIDLRSLPQFDAVMKELLANAPEVPGYIAGLDNPEKQVSDWKYRSGVREGYLLCLSNLGIKHD